MDHNQSFGPEDIGDRLADHIISGIRTPEELITFCIDEGMKPKHAHDLVKQVLKNLGIKL